MGKNIGMSITDGNEAVYGGNYYWGNTTQNLPFSYGFMGVTVRADGSLIQTAYSEAYPGCSAQRKCTDGTFGEWEWVNAPMILGVEYRTIERYHGKPVYVKTFDFGALPNATQKVVQYGDDTTRTIRACAVDNHGEIISGGTGYVQNFAHWLAMSTDNKNVGISCSGDATERTGCIVTVWHYKTTD